MLKSSIPTPLRAANAGDSAPAAAGASAWPAWLKEPLLHFLVVGAVVFAIRPTGNTL